MGRPCRPPHLPISCLKEGTVMNVDALYESLSALNKADLSFWQNTFLRFYRAWFESGRWKSYFEGLGTTLEVTVLALAFGVVLGVLFMLACITVFEAVLIRGFTNKLTILEIVSLFSIIACLCGGLVCLNVQSFSFLKLFMSFVLLIFGFCSTPLLTMLVAAIGGLGALVATNNPMFFAPFVIWALAILLFKKRYRIFMVIALVCVELLIGYYFCLYTSFGIIEILPILISSAVFVLLPKNLCRYEFDLSQYVEGRNDA